MGMQLLNFQTFAIFSFKFILVEVLVLMLIVNKNIKLYILQAKEYLELPEVMSYVVDPELKHFSYDDLKVICEVVNVCLNPDPSKRPSMQELSSTLESGIDTSISVELKASSLAWAELALSS